jgi:argininosuccinate lyase
MEHLIRLGIPQRTGQEIVGKLVAECERRGCRLAELDPADFAAADPRIGPEVRDSLGVANAINAFVSYGSTAPAEVDRQLALWRERLGE